MNIQLKKGSLDLCVLSLLARSDMYGYELVHKMSEAIDISEGTIYPLLKRIRQEGHVDTYIVESSEGPPRKYYKITESGKKKCNELLHEWTSFTDSMMKILKGVI